MRFVKAITREVFKSLPKLFGLAHRNAFVRTTSNEFLMDVLFYFVPLACAFLSQDLAKKVRLIHSDTITKIIS